MYKKIILTVFGIFIVAGAFSLSALATVATSDTEIIVEKDEVIDDDYFAGGESVIIEGTIKGDLYAAGGTVTIKGTVHGDVLAAGGIVVISGIIDEDVRVAGGDVSIRGAAIGDSASVFGGSVAIDDETTVGGGLVFGAGMVTSDAQVGRGITGGSGTLVLNGTVGKDVLLGVDRLRVKDDTTIGGDLTYYSDYVAEIDDEATIGGETRKHAPPVPEPADFDVNQLLGGASIAFQVIGYLSALLVGLLVLRFAEPILNTTQNNIKDHPWGSLLWGVLVLFVTPLFLLLVMVTIIGIPLAFILGGFYLLEIYLAKLVVGAVFGQWIAELTSNEDMNKYLRFALGLGLYYVLLLIPVFGFFVASASLLFGLGAIFLWKKEFLMGK